MIKNLNDIKKAYEKEIITFIDNHKELNNIEAYLNKLSNCLLGIYISDWNDDTPNIFIERLKKNRFC